MSPNGNSSSAGGTADAATTLYTALHSVVPGSVVCLEAGTYDASSNIMLSRSGSSSAPVYYRNYGGTALIQYTGGSGSGGVLQTANGKNWSGVHDIVIDGLTIDGADLIGGGIFVTRGAHHITIRNCVIRNTGATGIALNATDYVTVTNNQIYHTGYNQGWSSGISLWYGGSSATYGGTTAWYDSAAGFHNIIADNIVSGAYDNSSYHSDGNGIIVDGSGSIPPALIVNNLVYENGGRGIEVYYNNGDIWVVNNTAYADGLDLRVDGGEAPEFAATEASNVHWVNDLAYGRENGTSYTTAYTYDNYSSTVSWSTNLGYNGSTVGVTGSNSQYRIADPLFTSPPAVPTGSTPWASALRPWNVGRDFTLQSSSPAVDAGTSPTSGMDSTEASDAQPFLSTDLAGNALVQGSAVDLGAYEG